jgi:hypothetical protein
MLCFEPIECMSLTLKQPLDGFAVISLIKPERNWTVASLENELKSLCELMLMEDNFLSFFANEFSFV